MQIEIIYTDILNDCEGYGEIYDNTLYILVKKQYEHDKVMTDLIVSKIIRRLGINLRD